MKKYIAITDKQGLVIEEFNGGWSICSAWMGRDEVPQLNWCTVFKGRDDKEGKRQPIKLYLGKDPAPVLEEMLSVIKAPAQRTFLGPDDQEPPF